MDQSTRPGDLGKTNNFQGEELDKDSKIINAIGNIDELIAYIGLIRYILPQENSFLIDTQKQLSSIAANIAKYENQKSYQTVKLLEEKIVYFKKNSPEINYFYLPGDKEKPIFINICRTICRRCERSVVNIKPTNTNACAYLNRLSTYLFALQIFYHYQ